MKYAYTCSAEQRCKISDLPQEYFEGNSEVEIFTNSGLNVFTEDGNIDIKETPLVWIVQHMMFETPDVSCPVCESTARKVMQRVTAYFRGNCYLDIEGCRRNMNIQLLQDDDPYGHMRQPGEKDDMIAKLKQGNKPKPKHFPMSKSK